MAVGQEILPDKKGRFFGLKQTNKQYLHGQSDLKPG